MSISQLSMVQGRGGVEGEVDLNDRSFTVSPEEVDDKFYQGNSGFSKEGTNLVDLAQ